ncbi:Protein trichome birefringence-like 12 [Asimina triloba]
MVGLPSAIKSKKPYISHALFPLLKLLMAAKLLSSTIFPGLLLLSCTFIFLYTDLLSLRSPPNPILPNPTFSNSQTYPPPLSKTPSVHCILTQGRWIWIQDPHYRPIYGPDCPFHRYAWNCLRNQRENMEGINSWRWKPQGCASPRIDPVAFLSSMRGRRIGFVGDSLNENFLVSMLCILRTADGGARKWKRKRAWRGGHFPKYNVTVGYHRAVLLAKYESYGIAYVDQWWQPANQSNLSGQDGLKGTYRVDVDIPADDWVKITEFYDVLVFNTGHWWGPDKFPNETPLVFYKEGKPILPPLGIFEGLQVVLDSMVSFIEREVPRGTLKLWRTQSPRHFYGGDWNQNGSCLFDAPLEEGQVFGEELFLLVMGDLYQFGCCPCKQLDQWFDPKRKGANKEAREVNRLIQRALQGTGIQLLDLTHLSEFRADAHPAIWLGKKDAVAVWGQDCMHWCLPGLPDTWVDILSALILHHFETG